MTHTPGPWTYLPRGAEQFENDPLDDYRGILAGHGFFPHGFHIMHFMSESDAKLIAAAPELYEALKLMINFADHWYDHDNGASEELTAARAILAKAGNWP
jgi:hypothetical protein